MKQSERVDGDLTTPDMQGEAQTPQRLPRGVPPAPAQVGRYLLLRPLGAGGMGVVYAAYDPDLDRKVALKLVRPDMDMGTDPELSRARLLREAQAMARVSHPNVIPIFDVGMWGAQVFLAMELLEGGTLSQWLRQAPRSWREVLEVFLAAGRGLVAAHAAGLVHRDFKPSNVLVSPRGRVCVTDFGLARHVDTPRSEEEPTRELTQEDVPASERRMVESTPLTRPGAVMGTPQYMPPEQVLGGELDARSDQFSFCVALYHALHAQWPFEARRMQSLLDARELDAPGLALIQEPPRDTKVPAWVRQAVMRGLALKPAERFPTMEALLEALSQQQRRFQRQRWAAGTAVAGLGLALVAGALYQQSQVCADAGRPMDEVWAPGARARVEAAFLSTRSPLARDMAARASDVLDGYARAWAEQSTEACEATRVREVQPEELRVRRVLCLERRRKDVRAVVELLARADPGVVEKAMDAVHALPGLGACADVEALAGQQPPPEEPGRRAEVERLEAEVAELKALVDAGRFQAALERADALEAPARATGYLPLLAELRMQRGWAKDQLGTPADAVPALRQALYDAEAARADRLKVTILNRLLFVEEGQRRFQEAEGWSGLAEAALRRLGGDAVLESEVRMNQANLAVAQGDLPRARTLLDEAWARAEEALAPGHPKRARILFLQGRVALGLGEHERAVTLLREALRRTEASVGRLHPDTARRHGLLSWALREKRDFRGALEHARALVDIREALLGPDHLEVARALDEVGMCLLGLERHAEALAVYEQALALKRREVEPGGEDLQYSYDGVGQALLGLGRAKDAVEPLRQAVGFTSAPADVLADSGLVLARALWEAGQPDEARGAAMQAMARFTQASRPERVAEASAWLAAHPAPSARKAARPARGRGRR